MNWKFFEKEDLKWIEEISSDFLKESAWGEKVEISKEKVENYFLAATNKPNMFGIISLNGEERTGFLIGCVLEFPYSKDLFARQLELYVIPKFRGKMIGIQLMKKFIDWSKTNKAKEVIFEVSTKMGNFDKMAKRLNMDNIGTSYRRTL